MGSRKKHYGDGDLAGQILGGLGRNSKYPRVRLDRTNGNRQSPLRKSVQVQPIAEPPPGITELSGIPPLVGEYDPYNQLNFTAATHA